MSSDLRKAILENISIEELLREEGFEVIPRGRKLTVKGHDSLVITPDKGVFTWNSRGFAGSVIDLYMGLHGCDARTAMTMAEKGLGIALLPASMLPLSHQLKACAITDADLTTEILLAWRKGRLPSDLRDFLKMWDET